MAKRKPPAAPKNPDLLKWAEGKRGELTWDAFANLVAIEKGGSLKRQIVKFGTLATDTALRLAAVTETDPSWLLRLGGKSDIAEIIVRLYGDPRPIPVPDAARVTASLAAMEQDLAQLRRQMAGALGLSPESKPVIEESPVLPPATASKPRKRGGRSRGERKAG